MKQLINKANGKIAYQYFIANGVNYYAIVGETGELPEHCFLNSDWVDTEGLWKEFKKQPIQYCHHPNLPIRYFTLGDNYSIKECFAYSEHDKNVVTNYPHIYFQNRKDLEYAIRDIKPVYPAGAVEDLIGFAQVVLDSTKVPSYERVHAQRSIDKLKTFKK